MLGSAGLAAPGGTGDALDDTGDDEEGAQGADLALALKAVVVDAFAVAAAGPDAGAEAVGHSISDELLWCAPYWPRLDVVVPLAVVRHEASGAVSGSEESLALVVLQLLAGDGDWRHWAEVCDEAELDVPRAMLSLLGGALDK